MCRQAAAGAAEAADHRRGCVGREARRNLAEAELARHAQQLAREHSVRRVQELARTFGQPGRRAHRKAPGMRGALIAAKKVNRSQSSPANSATHAMHAQTSASDDAPRESAKSHASGAAKPPNAAQNSRQRSTCESCETSSSAERLRSPWRLSRRWARAESSPLILSAVSA